MYNWKKMPAGTFILKEEKQATGFKVVKDRFTVMMCCNATGTHRLPLLIVYKARRPHCYGHQDMSKLDVCWNKAAWVNGKISQIAGQILLA